MANVTYLLGAGASYSAFPIVNEIPEALSNVIIELRRIHDNPIVTDSGSLNIINDYKKNLGAAIKDLTDLLQGCNDHLSIDTYAKMLFLTRNEKYSQVKNAISLFFELLPLIQDEIISTNLIHHRASRRFDNLDKRYDAFLASILQGSFDKLPNNVRIITYNYDHQFKNAYSRYLLHARRSEDIDSFLNCYSRNENVRKHNTTAFSIYKINGSSGFLNDNKCISHLNNKSSNLGSIADCIINYYNYAYLEKHFTSGVSFAWESEPEEDDFIDKTRLATTMSDVLVVIGYSFPYFNRKIDECIFRRDSMHELTKIYVQDKNANEIIERIKAIRPQVDEPSLKCIPIYNTHQFYLPNEL